MSEIAEITVVVTNYNYEEYLDSCLQSVKDQDFDRWNCLVIDDASTDNSAQEIRRLTENDDRFHLMLLEENVGCAAARNLGLDWVTAPMLIFLDADDYLFTSALTEMKACLDENPEVGFAYCQPALVPYVLPEYDFGHLLVDNFISITSLLRTATIGEIRFETQWPQLEDWVFWATLGINGVYGQLVDTQLFYYRVHKQSRNHALPTRMDVMKLIDEIGKELAVRWIEAKRAERLSEPNLSPLVLPPS
jgi:glycosyltransferase involved in cell wall biosynthesis